MADTDKDKTAHAPPAAKAPPPAAVPAPEESDAHAGHLAQKALAEQVEADKWAGVAAGKSPADALAEAQAKHATKAHGAAPENKGA